MSATDARPETARETFSPYAFPCAACGRWSGDVLRATPDQVVCRECVRQPGEAHLEAALHAPEAA